jgi:hypothetical protein
MIAAFASAPLITHIARAYYSRVIILKASRNPRPFTLPLTILKAMQRAPQGLTPMQATVVLNAAAGGIAHP